MRRPLGISLALAGLICLIWVGFAVFDQHAFQREQGKVLEKSVAAPTARSAPAPAPVPKPRERLARQALVGRIEIPRLKLSAIVSEGDDEKTLKKAVGHLPDTPLPWEDGNSALAAHRDSFFRPLKGIRVGDEIQLTTPRGVFMYRVSETFITTPRNVSILRPRGRNELTLVTCYPFNFVGDAPDRFIVHAERIDVPSQAHSARVGVENLATAAPVRNAIR